MFSFFFVQDKLEVVILSQQKIPENRLVFLCKRLNSKVVDDLEQKTLCVVRRRKRFPKKTRSISINHNVFGASFGRSIKTIAPIFAKSKRRVDANYLTQSQSHYHSNKYQEQKLNIPSHTSVLFASPHKKFSQLSRDESKVGGSAKVSTKEPSVHHQIKSKKFEPHAGSKAEEVIKALNKLNIQYPSRSHEKVETTEAHMKVAAGMSGVVVRDLLLKEKRLKTVFLVIFDGKRPDINLKALGHHL
ncbi:hypothetical protein RFI_17888, partial [Reticulomyxa filosa]